MSTAELLGLLQAADPAEGTVDAPYPGLHYYRSSAPTRYRKVPILGPRLIVAAQGRKIAHFPGGALTYDAAHYLLITGGTRMEGQVVEASPDKPYLAFCLALSPETVARTLIALADAEPVATPAPPAPPVPAYVAPLDEVVTSALVRLLRATRDPVEARVLAPLVMNELVFRLLRSDAAAYVRSAVQGGDVSIQEAMRYMRENATRALSVEQVARHVGMSSSHFAHRFSTVARVSPMRFLKQLRLEAARELMLGQRARAGEAANQVGYESTSHFNRDFKQAFGASPGEYVKRVREG